MEWSNYFKEKKITLMGLGLLGRGVGDARFLAQCGARLIITDLKSEEELKESLLQLKDFPQITFHLGGHKLGDFKDRDLVIKAAGIPLDSPFIAEAQGNKIPVRMSADLFAELSGAPIVGITGTRGKSTVTHLIAHILSQAGREVLLGGNVQGVSTLALLPQVTANSIAVLELDSWQLQGFGEAKISPQVAVFTTFMPDHMNYYKNDMRAYFADKANIFVNQTEDDTLVLGEQVVPFVEEFGFKDRINARTTIVSTKALPKSWELKIPGEHNRYNAALAMVAAEALGVDKEEIKSVIESFSGVAGRLEFLKEVRGVRIYNDTTATVPEATIVALKALDPEEKKNILLIAGGADKGLDVEDLKTEISKRTKKTYFLAGSGTGRIRGKEKVFDSLKSALESAMADAQEGDIVLLSPAFASFGMFKNEYDRGEQFNQLVKQI